jgi:hypothetical protein
MEKKFIVQAFNNRYSRWMFICEEENGFNTNYVLKDDPSNISKFNTKEDAEFYFKHHVKFEHGDKKDYWLKIEKIYIFIDEK